MILPNCDRVAIETLFASFVSLFIYTNAYSLCHIGSHIQTHIHCVTAVLTETLAVCKLCQACELIHTKASAASVVEANFQQLFFHLGVSPIFRGLP